MHMIEQPGQRYARGPALRHCQLIKPPLGALPFLNGLVATIKDRDETKLKLEGIAFDECTVEHLDGMHKSNLPRPAEGGGEDGF